MKIPNFLPPFVTPDKQTIEQAPCLAGYYCQHTPKNAILPEVDPTPTTKENTKPSIVDSVPILFQWAASFIPNQKLSPPNLSLPSLRNMIPSIPTAVSFTLRHTWKLWKALPPSIQLTTAMAAGILTLKAWERIKGFKANVHNTNTNTNKNEVTINVAPKSTASKEAPVTVSKGKEGTVIAIHC